MSDAEKTAEATENYTPWHNTHHAILDRLVGIAPVSEDERRELRMQLADAREQLENPEQFKEDREAREKEAKAKRKAELQAELDKL